MDYEDYYVDDDDWEEPRTPSRKKRNIASFNDETASRSDTVIVPPVNEKPYYVKRLERAIGNRAYNVGPQLERYNLDTLKLMDAHHRPSDFGGNRLRETDDQLLRSVLCILSYEGNKANSFDATITAFKVIKEHHVLESENLTSLRPKQIDMIAAASKFLVETNLNDYAPPRLTHYVMSRPDDVESVISYAEHFFKRKDDAHSVDLTHLTEYIENEVTALREGGL